MFTPLRYRHKIAVIIFVFTLLPMLVLGSFLTSRIWSSKVKDILAEKNAQLESSVLGIDAMLNSNLNKILYINNNYYIINYLETNSDQNLLGIMNFSSYLQSIMKAVNSADFQAEMVIYALKDTNYNGEYLRSISNIESELTAAGISLKDEILSAADEQIVWKIRREKVNVNIDTELDYIYAYKKIISLNKPLAIIEMRIPLHQFSGFFQYDMPPGSYVEFDESNGPYNSMILTTDEANPKSESQSSFYALSQELKLDIGTVTWYVPKSIVMDDLKWYWITVLAIFLVIVGILVFTVEFVSYNLTKKLETLLRKMNKNVESLINDDETIHIYSTPDEFSKLGNAFYELIRKVKEYYKRITDFELERKVLETQLLQERFNPHFLYNTLSTIRWISTDARVKEVVNSMVKYYRIALNKGSSIITITQELEMIEEYLRLQKFAYGNEFAYAIDWDKEIGDRPVLKHLLQPIVENAVLHGLNGREAGGEIRISATKQEDNIIFAIWDNGAGMDAGKVEQLLGGQTNGQFGGYGMKNVQKRLEIFYQRKYSLEIQSKSGEGTTVFIQVPADPDDNLQMEIAR